MPVPPIPTWFSAEDKARVERKSGKIDRLKLQRQQKPGPNLRLRRRINQINRSRSALLDKTPPVPPAAPTTPQPMPWNTRFETTSAGLNKNYADTQAALGVRQQGIEQSYGFNDASNPYARARLLEQSFNQQRAGLTNRMAAAGQLYSGAFGNAQDYARGNFENEYDRLRRSYLGEVQGVQDDRLQAENELAERLIEAEAKRLEEAAAERPEGIEVPKGIQPSWKTKSPSHHTSKIRRVSKRLRHTKGKKKRAALKAKLGRQRTERAAARAERFPGSDQTIRTLEGESA